MHNCRNNNQKQARLTAGKIYKSKRQPLTQISHYPRSLLIDQFYFENLRQNKSQNLRSDKQKVIKFVGQTQENIKLIIQNLDSLNQCQNKIFMNKQKVRIQYEFHQILQIFYQKIAKIRNERSFYKKTYQNQLQNYEEDKKNYLNQLKNLNQLHLAEINKIKQQKLSIMKQKQSLFQKYENQSKKRQYFQRECHILQQKLKVNKQINALSDLQFVNRTQQNLLNQNLSQSEQNFQNNLLFDKICNQKDQISSSQSSYQGKNKVYKVMKNHKNKNNQNFLFSQNTKSVLQKRSVRKAINQQSQNNANIDKQQIKHLKRLLKQYNLPPYQLGVLIQQYLKQLQSTSYTRDKILKNGLFNRQSSNMFQ